VSWRVTVPCTRAQGEATGAMDELPGFASPPVLVADEPDPAKPDEWLIHAYFEQPPTDEEIAVIAGLGKGGARKSKPSARPTG
jgi:ribosomal protein L11 methyltransferase